MKIATLINDAGNQRVRAFRTGGWWLADKGVALGATLISQVILVRALGSAGFGELSYLLALSSLLLPVAQMGLAGLVVRAILEPGSNERAVLQSAMWLRLVGSCIALLAGFSYWIWLEPQPDSRAIFLLLCMSQIALVAGVVEFRFQARMDAARFATIRMCVVVCAALAKIIVATWSGDVAWVVTIFALENIALGIGYFFAYRSATGHQLKPQRDPEWTDWFQQRAPWLFLSGVAEVLYLKIDVVMLEWLRGSAETGVYSAAARLSEVWYLVPVVIVATIFPTLMSERDNTARWNQHLQMTLDGLVAIALAIAILIQMLAPMLVALLFGEAFAAAASILALHIWAAIFVFMRALFSRWLIAEDLLKFSLLTHGIGAITNILLNLWLIPIHGGLGAAAATVISYAAAGWLSLFVHHRTRPIAMMMTRAILLPLRPRAIAKLWRAIR